jgi:protein-S-isoprenylcysteine O-methyltransferase Ste14
MAIVFLIRRPHQSVDRDLRHQAVAALAFVSGAGFMGQAPTGGPLVQGISQGIVFGANILAVINVATLGRSFGVFIAFRRLRTNGIYGLVRHPMFATDMLLRFAFFISHANVITLIVLIVSIVFYVARAQLEERFLSQHSDYQEYMRKVPYRFIPGIV